ncbi:hypothetical protein G4G93_07530 [Methylobacterium sp. DB0501]|uniref:hypothetical protein n=1 Tax=Methylobacterium sp. DB0501 TaxID=2709665 RepID=UPI0013EB399D|nr:hypothetical protein [Methylobacterium sp. DB0501]NGM33785.1 hypothetical protein [Methylobacterium sp. DB0501]
MNVVAFPAIEQYRALLARGNPETARGAANDDLFVGLALSGGEAAATARACRASDLRRVEIELVAPASDETAAFVLDAVLEVLAHGGCIRDSATALRDVPPYITSLDAARAFVARTLPGFFLVSGSCARFGHASVGPDYGGPDGERLLREWPRDGVAEVGWHEELPHADGPHREPCAILAAAGRALAYPNERT